jgi:DNA helicase-2/ATP-dependent DNA helicase PcrA
VRWRYRHVLVDEAQDLNPLQHRFLELIVDGRNDLYLVGDPAQAIYGFNGSDPTLLSDVSSRLPGVEVIHLPTNHRCTPQIVAAGIHVLRTGEYGSDAVSARGDGMAVRVVAADDGDHEAALVAKLIRSFDPALVRTGAVAVLARTNAQLARLATVLTTSGVPIRRRELAPGTPLANAVRSATAQRSASRLRAWAHDVLDPDTGALGPDDAAERRVAAATLDFLRDQPSGDGAALRTWILSTNQVTAPDESAGVELLTFHGAKGREWNTVVVTGVETGLVPHRSATTGGARAEEARLLHVALTRATDRLLLTWAARRGGYRRRISPLIEGLDLEEAPLIPPPPELRAAPDRERGALDRLVAWREHTARAATVLPTDVCTDADLSAIAAAAPTSVEELAAATSLSPLTAARHFPAIRAALEPPSCP